MKNYFNKNAVLLGFAFISLILAGIYFPYLEFTASFSHENSDHADIRSKDNEISLNLNNKKLKQQMADLKDKDFALSEKNDRPSPTEPETTITPVLDDNFNAPAVGEYADQINQQDIIDKAESKGYQAQLTEQESAIPPISNKDVSAKSTGEYADQINQQDILAKAKLEGYHSPEGP